MPKLGKCVNICDGCLYGAPHSCTEVDFTCLDMEDSWKYGWEKGMAHAISVLRSGKDLNTLLKEMGWESMEKQEVDPYMVCDTCEKYVPHRWRPSPEAGPYFRCSECGEPTNAG